MILPSKNSEERKKAEKKYRKEYQEKHRERRAKQTREWREKNRERQRKNMKDWQTKNRLHINKYQRERNKKIRSKVRGYAKKYYVKNRSKIRVYQKKSYDKNPEKSKKEARERRAKGEKRRTALKIKIFYIYSKKLSNSKIPCCACCKEKFSHEFLAIDHINGRKIHGHKKGWGGTAMYHWLEKNNYPDGFQVLCHNCNIAKGVFGICPHQK